MVVLVKVDVSGMAVPPGTRTSGTGLATMTIARIGGSDAFDLARLHSLRLASAVGLSSSRPSEDAFPQRSLQQTI